jgi:two-component system response regulator FixJ
MAEADNEHKAAVYVVDDDPVATAFAAGAADHAGFVSRAFVSAEAFLATVSDHHRGCIVLDLQLDGMPGLQLQDELNQRGVRMPVIVVSGRGNVSAAVQAMKQQAYDFFEKPVPLETLASAIRRAIDSDGAKAADRACTNAVRDRFATLSPRERQVMASVVDGMANKQIAAKLDLSEKTIEVHRGNVMRKMGVESVAALVRASMHCDLATARGSIGIPPRAS